MTVDRLAQIQRDVGLTPTIVGVPGRPGAYNPRVIGGHWSAVRSTPANPHPARNAVTKGRSDLIGPLYGDLVPFQRSASILEIILITVGRTNNYGMAQRSRVLDAAAGRPIPRRPGADTHGCNDIVDAVAVDYHPAQGPPTAAMVEAFIRGVAARMIYRNLPTHAYIDHAAGTRRRIDLLESESGWPSPAQIVQRAAAVMAAYYKEGSWFDMATEEDLRRVIREELGRDDHLITDGTHQYLVREVPRKAIRVQTPARFDELLTEYPHRGRVETNYLRSRYEVVL